LKLPTRWKSFYLKCLEVPILGKFLIGPLLRLLWKIINFFNKNSVASADNNGLITTYASTIVSLRKQVMSLELRIEAMEVDLSTARQASATTVHMLSSALEGLSKKSASQDNTLDFQMKIFSAAISGLHQRN
jgi:hypothetical protein